MRVFTPADILLPRVEDMTKWSCIACDQFTSEPEYWREAERLVGNAPSTLRLMLPEAWLGLRDSAAETRKIYAAMSDYVNRGLFETVENSYIYVERTLPSGAVRRGLVGKLDLECYDWAPGSTTPVRATEGTVESRLPARVAVRRGASLEMPHIMVFLDDPENALIPSAAGGELLYDFELMQGGGRIRGSRVSGETAERLRAALDTPEGVQRVDIVSARDMYDAVLSRADRQDMIIKAAAVGDYRPAETASEKLKKGEGEMTVALARNPDILAELGRRKHPGQLLCGFAMETQNLLDNAESKLQRKNCDMLVANSLRDKGAGFGTDTNIVTLISNGGTETLPLMSKREVAHRIWDAALALRGAEHAGQ